MESSTDCLQRMIEEFADQPEGMPMASNAKKDRQFLRVSTTFRISKSMASKPSQQLQKLLLLESRYVIYLLRMPFQYRLNPNGASHTIVTCYCFACRYIICVDTATNSLKISISTPDLKPIPYRSSSKNKRYGLLLTPPV